MFLNDLHNKPFPFFHYQLRVSEDEDFVEVQQKLLVKIVDGLLFIIL
jgi:hypothetical protein